MQESDEGAIIVVWNRLSAGELRGSDAGRERGVGPYGRGESTRWARWGRGGEAVGWRASEVIHFYITLYLP
jgi:hypothetical protein